MNKKQKPYDQMNSAELAEATKEYDKEFAFLKGRPLSAAGRKAHKLAAAAGRQVAKRGKGRPRMGDRSTRIDATIDKGLLRDADTYARAHNLNRSQLLTRALRLAMSEMAQ